MMIISSFPTTIIKIASGNIRKINHFEKFDLLKNYCQAIEKNFLFFSEKNSLQESARSKFLSESISFNFFLPIHIQTFIFKNL